MAAYRAAKLRLFDTLLPAGAAAAACTGMDGETLAALRAIARRRGLRLLSVGEAGEAIRLRAARPLPDGLALSLAAFGTAQEIHLPLPGRFQADNALLAAGAGGGAGLPADRALAALPKLTGVRGRMERAAVLANGAAVYVDYAHTPDALARLLAALRPAHRGAAACGVRRRRRPRPRQAPADGPGGGRGRRHGLGDGRQPAQRGPGGDPRRRAGRRAGRRGLPASAGARSPGRWPI